MGAATTVDRETVLTYLEGDLRIEPDVAQRILVESRAWHGPGLRQLAQHIRDHQHPLTRKQPTAPPAVIRVSVLLRAAGSQQVNVPTCAACNQVKHRLERYEDRLLCPACLKKTDVNACGSCGVLGPIHTKSSGMCRRCWRRDPANHRPCEQCGRVALPARSTPAGGRVCSRCYARPVATCVQCGQTARPIARDANGPICSSCYRYPRRPCSRCGKVTRVGRRDPDRGDICLRCVDKESAQDCAVCARHRPVAARWPLGPICGTCYDLRRSHPDRCPACGQIRVLIGIDCNGETICGPCNDPASLHRYTCRSCSTVGLNFAHRQCARCVLRDELTAALAGPADTVPHQVRPLIDAMLRCDEPYPLLDWLRQSRGARVLSQLLNTAGGVSHEALDSSPHTRTAHHLRGLLVQAGVLDARPDEHLVRAERFAATVADDLPPDQSKLLRQYANWYLLRRARAWSRRRPATYGTERRLRAEIRAAAAFVRWMQAEQLDLASLKQADLDRWLDANTTRRDALANFVRWTNRRGLTRGLRPAHRTRAVSTRVFDEEERLRQLRWCLDKEETPIDVRVAAAFVLLFGLPLASVLRLTTDDIQDEGPNSYLSVGTHRLLLPPQLARMIAMLRQRPMRRSTPVRVAQRTGWIFPSHRGQGVTTPAWMARRLAQHGFTTFRGRNTARLALAAVVPPAVLASQTGMSVGTAVAWSKLSARDWSTFVAARQRSGRTATAIDPDALDPAL